MLKFKKSKNENTDEAAFVSSKVLNPKEVEPKDEKPKEIKRSKKLLGFNDLKAIDEAFKHIRAFLLNNTKHEYCPVYAVVSAKAKDGNTLTAANLAISFAQLGKKTLLIEANMRTPKMTQLFGLAAERGLSDMLSLSDAGILDLSGTAIPSGIDCLDIVPSGQIPTNPSELLASKSFEAMIEKAKTVYEAIVVCLPPVCDYADASVVSESITGYLFTVRSERTDGKTAKSAIEKLKANGGNIIGTILTNVSKLNNKV